MPPKELEKPYKFYVAAPDGTKMEFGEIKELNVITDFCDDYEDSRIIETPSQEYEFTVRWSPNIRVLYFITHGRLPSNNWLRMHGYRPNRKKRCYGRRKIQSTDL